MTGRPANPLNLLAETKAVIVIVIVPLGQVSPTTILPADTFNQSWTLAVFFNLSIIKMMF